MNIKKAKNKIVIWLLALLLVAAPSNTLAHILSFTFQNAPLFYELDYKPCDSITRWFKAVNNSNQPRPVIIKAVNVTNFDNLDSQMHIVIKDNLVTLYDAPFHDFLTSNAITLKTLAPHELRQFDITISFACSAGNDYQLATLKFDLSVAFQGPTGDDEDECHSGDGEDGHDDPRFNKSCRTVMYGDWGSCKNHEQSRPIILKLPAGCNPTHAQLDDRVRTCPVTRPHLPVCKDKDKDRDKDKDKGKNKD